MKTPPITVRRWVRFETTLPDDHIEDEKDIVQFGGKTVAEEIAKIISRLGWAPDDVEYGGEHGWWFTVNVGGHFNYCQVTLIGDFFLLMDGKPFFGWLRKRPNLPYFDLLTKFAEELERDPRFSKVTWHTDDTVELGKNGATRPIGPADVLLDRDSWQGT